MAVLSPTDSQTLDRARLEGILSSRMLGIGYINPEGLLVQWLEADPALTELVADYYHRRIENLERQEGSKATYPIRPD